MQSGDECELSSPDNESTRDYFIRILRDAGVGEAVIRELLIELDLVIPEADSDTVGPEEEP